MRPELRSLEAYATLKAQSMGVALGLDGLSADLLRGNVDMLIVLAISTVGDAAVRILDKGKLDPQERAELEIFASYFEARFILEGRSTRSGNIRVLSAVAYALAGREASAALVLENVVTSQMTGDPQRAVVGVLCGAPIAETRVEGEPQVLLQNLVSFHAGSTSFEALTLLASESRQKVYRAESAEYCFYFDVLCAVILSDAQSDTIKVLNDYTRETALEWRTALNRAAFPGHLWPAQLEMARSGVFAGDSALVLMPTSSGKTRAIELVIRAAELSQRAKLVVVVAPFRALAAEIGLALLQGLQDLAGVRVNRLGEALKDDLSRQLRVLFGGAEVPGQLDVVVVTPEKLQFLLRHNADLAKLIDVLVLDEAHLFDSGQRGIAYEMLVTGLRDVATRGGQLVALSAAVRHGETLSKWLLGPEATIASVASTKVPRSSTSFMVWADDSGSLLVRDYSPFEVPDFQLEPSVLRRNLGRAGGERVDRWFPAKQKAQEARDVCLATFLTLARTGPTALFVGTKATVTTQLERVVEIHGRGYEDPLPFQYSDTGEVERIASLLASNLGDDSIEVSAAKLGVFGHHGGTPHGIRASIEHAARADSIHAIVCTSTLAQGVNLPFRFLVVSSFQQGANAMRVRDFQNLVGRAGRSGMHTEGMIVVADPRVWSERNERAERWRFVQAQRNLNSENAEPLGSSLLACVSPLGSNPLYGVGDSEVVEHLTSDAVSIEAWISANRTHADEIVDLVAGMRHVYAVVLELRSVSADRSEWTTIVSEFCRRTFAYEIGSGQQRELLERLFSLAAERIERAGIDPADDDAFVQASLDPGSSKLVSEWFAANSVDIVDAVTHEAAVEVLWPLLDLLGDETADRLEPKAELPGLIKLWVSGRSFGEIFMQARNRKITRVTPKTRQVAIRAEIMKFLLQTCVFNYSGVSAAVDQLAWATDSYQSGVFGSLSTSLRFGLEDALEISIHEAGLCDRVVARSTAELLRARGYSGATLSESLPEFGALISTHLRQFPSYFRNMFDALGAA